MSQARAIKNASAKALHYLASQQQPDGSFVGFSSMQQVPFYLNRTYRTTFTPALILTALSQLHDPVAATIRAKLAGFLLQQRSKQWSFNYWTRDSQEVNDMPYPDDLDDTFCALNALWLHDASLIDQAALASTVKLLVATESQVGGPYHTWLVAPDSPKAWRDIDLAVNANIAYFLSLVSNPLPNLTALMERAITQKVFHSRYYPTLYPVAYYVARAYHGPQKRQLAQYLLEWRQNDGSWGTPLHTALAMSSLVRLGEKDLRGAANYLLDTQETDGSWNAEAFCLDPVREDKTHYSGAPALTTAFALEALQLYKQRMAGSKLRQPRRARRPESLLQTHIILRATQELKALDKDLSLAARDMLDRTVHGKNGEEIILLPHLFHASFQTVPTLQEQLFVELGLANLYGWMAYTIYDDFLDDEGDPRLLSVANVTMRRSLDAFMRALPNNPTFYKLVQATFDTIDAANTWEVAQCRFAVREGIITVGKLPAYGRLDRLAQRSLGHTLAPLGVLAASGMPPDGEAAQALQKALRHYLIARQLNDDAHDWQADLQAGRITYVLAVILRELDIPAGGHALHDLLPIAERRFWRHTLGRICQRITRHTGLSREAIHQSNILKSGNIIETLLDNIDASVKRTRATAGQAERFLQAYRRQA